MTSEEDLIRMFSDDVSKLPNEDRELLERIQREDAELRAAGKIAYRQSGREHDNSPLGLDDNMKPFPLTKKSPDTDQEL